MPHPINNLTTMGIWKNISAFEDYFASCTGKILSLKTENPKILKPSVDKKGYQFVNIEGKSRRVHRLVANAFLNLNFFDNNICVLHKDDNTLNNNVVNLFLGTQQDNIKDMINKKRNSFGDNHSKKLSSKDVITIKQRLKNKEKGAWIAKNYNVHPSMICAIKNNRRWKHIKI